MSSPSSAMENMTMQKSSGVMERLLASTQSNLLVIYGILSFEVFYYPVMHQVFFGWFSLSLSGCS